MFERGKVYTHKNMLDCVMRVLYVLPFENHVELKVNWFNNRGMDLNVKETVKVKKSDFSNWYEWKGV